MSRDANTLLVSLELILVNAGQVVFDDGEGEPVQLVLAFIFQPSNQIFWKSGWPRPQKRQNHFCNLSGRIEISAKCRKGGNFPILTAKIFSKLKPQVLFSISKRKWLRLVIARFKCLEHFNETFPPSWNRSYFFHCYFEVYNLCVSRFQNSERKNSYI